MADDASIGKRIIQLALPSLATLLVEPLLVTIDSAMVGHLGTAPLAGLSLASTIVTTIVGVCIFLSYATTASASRLVGAHHPEQALRHGIEGVWLATFLGIVLASVMALGSHFFVGLFHSSPQVQAQAELYIRASALGIPAMLIVLAATGTLRGFADTRTPLWGTTLGAIANVPLNYVLIYIAELGIFGAGLGTAIAQTGIAVFLCYKISRLARTLHVSLYPSGTGVLRSLRGGIPLIIRTLCLRAAIIVQITCATALGTTALASNQIVMTMWNFAAFGLDALATAAQIIIGQSLGTRNINHVRDVLVVCQRWAIGTGALSACVFFGLSFIVPGFITSDPAVTHLAARAMWITSIALPIASLAYMLDGVLIGAGDARALARYMIISLLVFTPCALVIKIASADLGTSGMYWLWAAYAIVFMTIRTITMLWRVRGSTWMGIQ